MKTPSHPKHILVIRLSALGDVAMTVPVIRAITKQYPEVKITVLTREFFTPIFRNINRVEVFSVDVKRKHKGVLGLYKLSREIKTLKIDAIADLHNVLRSKILTGFLSGIKTVQINKGRKEKKDLISGKHFTQLKTTHQRYADVFRGLGFEVNLTSPEFPPKTILNETARQITGPKNKKWIGVAPFAAHKGKTYPAEKMLQVVQALAEEYKVFLFGGGIAEIEQLDTWENKPNLYNLAGKLSLAEELDVISNLDLMLSMDSGNAHLAAMFGIPVVTLWGVTHPYAGFAPFNQPAENNLLANRNSYPKIPTSVYGKTYPKAYENAAGSIPVEAIIKKIKANL
ncbi:MAG TPA: glycosyltransferase family 9 protein [Flavobacteriaceae bacterium]|nr:glycosyltransferase family 9 protein [Flavobacteriaceae bacterium]